MRLASRRVIYRTSDDDGAEIERTGHITSFYDTFEQVPDKGIFIPVTMALIEDCDTHEFSHILPINLIKFLG